MIADALSAWGSYDRDDPFPLFAAVREAAPVCKVRLADGCDAWLVTGFDEAKAALAEPRFSKDMQAALAASGDIVDEGLPGRDYARHLLNVDPPDHTRLRKLVGGAFTYKAMAALRPRVEEICAALLDGVERAGPEATVDLKQAFGFPLPITVIGEMLGMAPEDRLPVGEWFDQLLSPAGPDPRGEATAASASIVDYIGRLVAEKRARPGDDLVTELVLACDRRGELTEQELLSMILIMIVAGHDTTSSMILNGTVALLAHPAQRDALGRDPSLVPAAVEEIIRYNWVGLHATFRYATADVDLGGVTIPAGAQVLVCIAAALRDPSQFPDPEIFDIARAEGRHIGFGHGIHFCLGAPLARLEGQVAFTALLQRFPEMRLAVPPGELHWSHGDGIVLRGLAELPVVPGPAAPVRG